VTSLASSPEDGSATRIDPNYDKIVHDNARNPLDTFPRNFPIYGEVANLLLTCYGLVSDTANYLDLSRYFAVSLTSPLASSLLCRCNGIWETIRHNRHNGLLPEHTCYGLLWSSYGEWIWP